MDRLVVLDRGRIVEEGTHEDLLAARGAYAGLWQRQSGGFVTPPDPTRAVIQAVRPQDPAPGNRSDSEEQHIVK